MRYAGFWTAPAALGALLCSGCSPVEVTQEGSVSEAGGFLEPERRLASSDDDYCHAEVLRWRHDAATGALTIADSRLLLSCCGQRAMHAARIDSMVEVTERDEPEASGQRCDQVCAFDFTVSVPAVSARKVTVRLLRDVTDVQGSAELVWQGELDVTEAAGEVILDENAAGDACGDPAP